MTIYDLILKLLERGDDERANKLIDAVAWREKQDLTDDEIAWVKEVLLISCA